MIAAWMPWDGAEPPSYSDYIECPECGELMHRSSDLCITCKNKRLVEENDEDRGDIDRPDPPGMRLIWYPHAASMGARNKLIVRSLVCRQLGRYFRRNGNEDLAAKFRAKSLQYDQVLRHGTQHP